MPPHGIPKRKNETMIAKWKLKAVVQKGISHLPRRERINYWFQKHVTKGVELTDEHFGYKITHARDHLEYFTKYLERDLKSSTVLELGTGWYPIVPIAFYLSDLKSVYSLDLSDWMSAQNVITTCQKYVEWDKAGKLASYLPARNSAKWQYITELATKSQEQIKLDEVCAALNLNRLIGDARALGFEDDSFDLICSNNTFEHIPEAILIDILREFKRVVKGDGVMSHFIDMSDHFAHFDKTITIYNFLRYSDRAWRLIDNSIQPQNRLRFKDYKKIYTELGIPLTDEKYREGSLAELRQVPLDQKYKAYSEAELAISHGYLVSKMQKQ